MNTRDTVVRVRGVPRCAKVHYRTRTRITRGVGTTGLPAPVRKPTALQTICDVIYGAAIPCVVQVNGPIPYVVRIFIKFY